MSVYVDELRNYPRTRRWPYEQACHMTADTLDELHAFATKIQLRRSWFQPHDRWPHYDLTAKRRIVAIEKGAVEITAREFIKRFLNSGTR